MTPLADIARTHRLNIISYGDDTQLVLSLTENAKTRASFQNTMTNIATWMKSN